MIDKRNEAEFDDLLAMISSIAEAAVTHAPIKEDRARDAVAEYRRKWVQGEN